MGLGLRLVVIAVLVGAVLAATAWFRARQRADARPADWPPLPDHLLAARAGPGGTPAWVIFTTPFCASCRQIEAELARTRPAERVLVVDATEQPDLADRYRVQRAPTTLAVDGAGQVTGRFVGVEHIRQVLAA